MFDNINLFYFVLSFSVGMLFIYITTPEPRVVLKFPSPYNAGDVTYRDKSNSCYRYKADKTSCPMDKSVIKPQPIVEDFGKQQ
jgi:hypothetical protein